MVNRTDYTHRSFAPVLAVATAILFAMLFASPVFAEDSAAESQAQADPLVQGIEQSIAAYQDATAMVDNLANQIAVDEEHIAEIEQELPEQRENAAASIKRLYIFQQTEPGLLELMFSAEDFNDFITALEYMTAIHEHNTTQIVALQNMHDDLAQSKAMRTAELDAAMQKQDESLKALDSIRTSLAELRKRSKVSQRSGNSEDAQIASATLEEAQRLVGTLPAPIAEAVSQLTEAEIQEEERERQRAEAAEAAANAASAASGGQAIILSPVESLDPQDEGEYAGSEEIDLWASRIDSYLASYGAPLAGYGQAFARAAARYGVDPRIAPAISVIESGGGKVCFQPHNAWGWGSYGWSDWDTAIDGYLSGFARLYGPTLTPQGAQAYASSDAWQTWYNLLHSEMASI